MNELPGACFLFLAICVASAIALPDPARAATPGALSGDNSGDPTGDGGEPAGAAAGADVKTPPPAAAQGAEENPLLAEWKGPYGGFPAFDKIKVAHFKPALEASMEETLAEIDKIARNPEPPTFENTIVALERSGKRGGRVQNLFGIYGGTMSNPELQAIEREMAPRLAAFGDKITQNEALFKRIEAVYDSPDKAKLTPEQQRLVWLDFTNFVRAGARLDAKSKARMSEINQRLAQLYTTFGQNVLADETDLYLTIDKAEDLAGLPESVKEGAEASAAEKKLAGKWVITNTRSAIEPFLTYAERRDLREKAWRMFAGRGDNGDKNDNNALIGEILKLRRERANLLGYSTHAHWRLENAMAGKPENALALMESVWTPAAERVREEVADMQALADKEGAKITIEPWDYRFYAEKVRKERYDLDENQVKPYMQLDLLRDGMFWVAGELFGFQFSQLHDVPVVHPDVTVWKVSDKKTGEQIGLWYFDPYARAGKRSGAWMNAYRRQQRLEGEIKTIVSNNANFVPGKKGEPLLISWRDATTLFHEFGHALHGLSSNVTYPSLSGTAVARDYVEFPSQLLEHFLATPEVLQKFALHYQTGERIPQNLVDRIEKAATFNEGFRTVEYLSGALYDMKIHLADPDNIDPRAFEKEMSAALGMPREVVLRHRPTQFLHVFSGDGYSAGYYSYLWSDVLTADAWQAFLEGKGAYDREVAARLVKNVFSVGNTIDPAAGFRGFRGRDPDTAALMKKRGFVSAGNTPSTK
jgi:peptidyl-dipeptidase Dcp